MSKDIGQDAQTIHDLLMEWGAYRSGYDQNRFGLGYGRSLLGKVLKGLKGTTCGKCIGRGVVQDIVTKSRVACPICKGRGKVNLDARGKANPAMIRATGPNYGPDGVAEPEFCARVDKAFQRLKIRHRIVLTTRYIHFPRHTDSERRLKHINRWFERLGEKPISKRRMQNLLSEARGEIAKEIYSG